MLVVTIKAAYDIENVSVLEDISDCIRSALDELRSMGAARVEDVSVSEASVDDFMNDAGVTEFEFVLPAPTKAHIEFD